jgi:hypothetical protein
MAVAARTQAHAIFERIRELTRQQYRLKAELTHVHEDEYAHPSA